MITYRGSISAPLLSGSSPYKTMPYLLLLTSLCLIGTAIALAPLLTVQDQFHTTFSDDIKVPVVLGVMSRCPDAILCESVFDRVLQRVGDKVDISLSFIAMYVHVWVS